MTPRRSRRRSPDIDRIFHALGDPSRRAIVVRLSRGPVSVSQLAAPMGITLAAVIQHMQVLEKSGLARTSKTGRTRTCALEPSGLAAAQDWMSELRSMWERRLDRLEELLESEP